MKKPCESPMPIKIYKRRWLQLGLFFLSTALNMMQWIQFTIIGNVISRYYGVSSLTVDWTSIIFHASYVILMFPVSYVMDRVGLRWSCLIGSIGTSIGSWIKSISSSPDRFLVVFIGQTIVATAAIFLQNSSVWLTSNWFGETEIATATAISSSAGLAGVALFFVATPLMVRNHENIRDIGEDLSNFFFAVAVLCTLVTLALFFFFQERPLLPPSEAKGIQRRNNAHKSDGFRRKIGKILSNKSYLVLWNSFGMNTGVFNAACTLLNPLFLAHFQNGEAQAGKLGVAMTVVGNLASIFFGMILDKTKKFKVLGIFLMVFTIIGEILFAVSLTLEIEWLVFVSASAIGAFSVSYGCIGYELSAELTYPDPEELSSGMLNLASQVYGMILASIVGSLLRNYGDTSAHACLTLTLLIALILTIMNKNHLRRQNARETAEFDYKADTLLKFVKSNEISKPQKLDP